MKQLCHRCQSCCDGYTHRSEDTLGNHLFFCTHFCANHHHRITGDLVIRISPYYITHWRKSALDLEIERMYLFTPIAEAMLPDVPERLNDASLWPHHSH